MLITIEPIAAIIPPMTERILGISDKKIAAKINVNIGMRYKALDKQQC
ncbi:hypothetical protein GCM10010995_12830 [Cysteiniphilum litorale]|uniref:Uncharacterized protein n=1 Tax=Cysteiniphilum litorale TaxID=2056700 RepID=A0A8J2Z466_9GAMM|nr:hypothetical protein GCM10010995_12830 [Cysteiniphilum litorale]